MPYTETIIGTNDAIESEQLVEFRLLYQGDLLAASRHNTRASHKHKIRLKFHPQLRRLWAVKNGLRQLAEYKGNPGNGEPESVDMPRFDRGIAAIGRNWSKAGIDFVPLVIEEFVPRCSLDILLLRPEGKQYINEQGDLDGQLKTLFDALKRPRNAEEMPKYTPTIDEKPLFCLLQDDKMISQVNITADQLLLLPDTREVKANDVFVTIHVRLNHAHGGSFDRYWDS